LESHGTTEPVSGQIAAATAQKARMRRRADRVWRLVQTSWEGPDVPDAVELIVTIRVTPPVRPVP
jgi:hypothetical protein